VAKGHTFVEADVRIEGEAGRILPQIARLALP
jgi:hypothetical protein